ncbi:hypothetical protein FJY93_02290 [Candidatus Kaiserbacteria bacterium]|nr:hypothetical protein [Candidatus Kaiserbacteria bacterium]
MTPEQGNRIEQKMDKYFELIMGKMNTMEDAAEEFREEVRAEFNGLKNRMGAQDNRIDDESARRTDLENRVRVVLPNLPQAPERV